jgi:hypothetical protein
VLTAAELIPADELREERPGEANAA